MRCSQYLFFPIGHDTIRFYDLMGILRVSIIIRILQLNECHHCITNRHCRIRYMCINGQKCFDRIEIKFVIRAPTDLFSFIYFNAIVIRMDAVALSGTIYQPQSIKL